MIRAEAFLDIGLAVLDNEDVFSSEKGEFSVRAEGILRDGGVFKHYGHALTLRRRQTEEKKEQNPESQKGKNQYQIAPFHIFGHDVLTYGKTASAEEASFL